MTDERIDCFNCGTPNPEWAQVCRSCGVALRHGETRIVPAERFPTDRDSLVSMAAVIGSILAAVLVGLFVSGIIPQASGVALETPTPSATPSISAGPSGTPAVPTDTPAPTPSATPGLPGTVVFGTTLDADKQVTDPTDTFTPGMTFAHSITSTEPFGAETIREGIVRINEDGSEGDQIVDPATNQLSVNPEATSAGYVATDAANFVRDWGPGVYEMRVYVGETLIARGQFRLAEG